MKTVIDVTVNETVVMVFFNIWYFLIYKKIIKKLTSGHDSSTITITSGFQNYITRKRKPHDIVVK